MRSPFGIHSPINSRRGGGPALDLDFTSGVLPAGVTFTRAGGGGRINSSGLYEWVGADVPRFDYDPVTLACKGLLIEGNRTNFFAQSADANSAWTNKSGTTVLSDVETAPDGSTTAEAIVENTTTGGHYVERTVSLAANQFNTFEIFLKPKGNYREVWMHLYANGYADSIRAQFNTATGTVVGTNAGGAGSGVTASIKPFPNGWYRLRLTGQVTTSAVTDLKPRIAFINASTNYTGDGVSGVYFWGGDVQPGAFGSSHIPTVASPVTRAADVLTMTGLNFSRWFNPLEGTFAVDFSVFNTGINSGGGNEFSCVFDADSAAAANSDYNLFLSAAYPGYRGHVNVAGVPQAVFNSTLPLGTGAQMKYAIGYKANDFAASYNGAAALVDGSGTLPPSPDRLAIGSTNGGVGRHLFGHIRRLRYWPTRLSNAKLQELTA